MKPTHSTSTKRSGNTSSYQIKFESRESGGLGQIIEIARRPGLAVDSRGELDLRSAREGEGLMYGIYRPLSWFELVPARTAEPE